MLISQPRGLKPLMENQSIVHFKRLGSRIFTILLINMYSSFQNNVHTAKQMQYTLERILSDFLSNGFLIFFMYIEMSIVLYNGKNLQRSLQLSWPRYGRRVTNIEWNGSLQCNLFNITRCKSKSVSLHKRRSSPFDARNLRNCVYHKDT